MNISMNPRSMSRSHLGTGSTSASRYKINATVATHLPILHNMSTTSLITRKSGQSGSKLEHSNMIIKQLEPSTDQQKLEKFHKWCQKCKDTIAGILTKERSKSKFNSSIDHSYNEAQKSQKLDVLNVPEYVDEIFTNERNKPKFFNPKPDYMLPQKDINQKMRRILVDWLVKVHQKFKLLPETLYLTINIIDRYLSFEVVSRKILQLIGVTSMHIACKYEEIYPPEANDFVYITDNAYSKKELLDTEYKILKALEFNLTFASPYRHLERLSALTHSTHLFKYAKQVMDSSLTEYTMLKYQPESIAAGSLYLAHVINRKKGANSGSHNNSVSGSRSESFDNSTRLLTQISKQIGVSENNIKKCAIEVNTCRGDSQ